MTKDHLKAIAKTEVMDPGGTVNVSPYVVDPRGLRDACVERLEPTRRALFQGV